MAKSHVTSKAENAFLSRVTTHEQERANVDSSTPGIVYYGWADDLDAADSDAKWRILRKYTDGPYTYYHFANDNDGYTHVWDDRASYFDAATPASYASIYFDGVADRIVFASGAYQFDFNDAMSISCWVKFGTLANAQTIISNSTSGNVGWQLVKIATSNLFRFRMMEVNASNDLQATGAFAAVVNTWYHVVITKSTGSSVASCKLYVNGVQDTLTATVDTLTSGPTYTTQVMEIGSRANGQFLAGLFDNCMIFNRELTQAEVTELYASGMGITPSAFSGYADAASAYKIGEGDTNTAGGVDDLKDNYNGTMTSMLDTNIVGSFPGSVA